jgi:putative zinc finger/helix-turn-helix YgiT family protein
MQPSTPDFCPACDAADHPFALIQRETEQDFRGETFRVTSPALQCRHCGFGMLGPGHLEALRIATHDAYRRKHGFLTSGEILSRRKAMGLSQKRFAEYLGVGSASIERWESGTLVQDKASDLLLRQRTERGLYFNLRPAGRRKHTFAFSLPGSPALI